MVRARVAAVVAVLSLLVVACGQSVFDLEVGQCINLPDGNEVSTVDDVDCAEPHDAEVFALPTLPDGDFPGLTEVQSAGQEECLAAFEPYVGAPYETSALYFSFLNPTAETWADGDREIACLLVSGDDSQLTGSKEGSGE